MNEELELLQSFHALWKKKLIEKRFRYKNQEAAEVS